MAFTMLNVAHVLPAQCEFTNYIQKLQYGICLDKTGRSLACNPATSWSMTDLATAQLEERS